MPADDAKFRSAARSALAKVHRHLDRVESELTAADSELDGVGNAFFMWGNVDGGLRKGAYASDYRRLQEALASARAAVTKAEDATTALHHTADR